MHIFGDTPGKGRYRCVICNYEVEIKDKEKLELCPFCDGATYKNAD